MAMTVTMMMMMMAIILVVMVMVVARGASDETNIRGFAEADPGCGFSEVEKILVD